MTAEGALERVFDLAVVTGELMKLDLGAQGLTPARAEVVWLLNRRGPLTQRVLSQLLKCTPRNVTGLVDALEGLGLACREPHPSDRRATLVTLTSRGQAMAADWHTRHQEGAAALFHGVAADDLATFTRVLDVVVARLRADPRLGGQAPHEDPSQRGR